jgi:hypothetical protein
MIKPLQQSFLLLKLGTGPYFKCAQLCPFLTHTPPIVLQFQQSLIQCCTGMSTYQLGTSLDYFHMARVNQQPPMHQLAVLSTGWAAFFHSAPDGVHHSRFFLAADHCTSFLSFFFWILAVFPLDLTLHIATLPTFLPSQAHFPTFISTAPTLVPYL